jgi:hydrogenase expression/formation protein HypC
MCLAIPGRVISIDGMVANVELGGVERKVSLQLIPEARRNDYILVHAGIGIQIIDEDEALATLELFEEMFKEETVWEAEGN